jgi:hypothetical protein
LKSLFVPSDVPTRLAAWSGPLNQVYAVVLGSFYADVIRVAAAAGRPVRRRSLPGHAISCQRLVEEVGIHVESDGRFGTARVFIGSPSSWHTLDQQNAAPAAGITKTFSDVLSGAPDNRPQLAALLDYVCEGDTVVVWTLDRLGPAADLHKAARMPLRVVCS